MQPTTSAGMNGQDSPTVNTEACTAPHHHEWPTHGARDRG